MNITEIESTLRHAPAPMPPSGLQERLIEQVRLPRTAAGPGWKTSAPGVGQWLRRWWPALAPGAATVACAVVLGVQQAELQALNKSVGLLTEIRAASVRGTGAEVVTTTANSQGAAVVVEDELSRLQELVARLASEIEQLQRLQQENAALREELAALATGLTAEERTALANAREKAMLIQCVNNLKQMGLAAHVWANDHKDVFPPDFVSMTDQLSTPGVLWCPADTGRTAATDWASFTTSNCSYEYLTPDAQAYTEPNRVMFRCPIHGSIGLADGSAIMAVARTMPDALVMKDGKLYFEPERSSKAAPAQAPEQGAP